MGEPKLPAVQPPDLPDFNYSALDRVEEKSRCTPKARITLPRTRQTSALSQQLDLMQASTIDHGRIECTQSSIVTDDLSSRPPKHTISGIPSLHVRQPSTVDTEQVLLPQPLREHRERRAHAITPPIVIPARPLKTSLSTISMNSSYSKSPGSAINSPALAAMTDITPLPSPIFPEDPGAWRRDRARRHGSVGSLRNVMENTVQQDFTPDVPSNPTSRSSSVTKKRKPYPPLTPSSSSIDSKASRTLDKNHSRVKSLGESCSEPMHSVRPRNSTLSSVASSGSPPDLHVDSQLHRERHLASQRGFVHSGSDSASSLHSHQTTHTVNTAVPLPTPPPSNRSINDSDGDEAVHDDDELTSGTPITILTINDQSTKRTIQYKQIRPLGEGTFSKVVLATKEKLPAGLRLDQQVESSLDPKKLAAIKIVEHGPAGGADEDRMKVSLHREVAIMRCLSHPSLIDLRGYSDNSHESLLVLGYCPGGDLFELATENKESLKNVKLVQRIFAELVGALQHLHNKNIVHRDVKLESKFRLPFHLLSLSDHAADVLVNLRREEIAAIDDPTTYERSIVTLTDLGLSRTVDPDDPLLTTRCGSEAYAAPEIILGQPYNGCETDAWALGCVLFTLMELRLPFEPPPIRPGYRVRSRGQQTHRIARNEWVWAEFGDDYGEWDETRGAGWEAPREVVEGLLRKINKGRLTLDEVANLQWVRDGINVPGGLRRGYEDDEVEKCLS